MEEASDLERAVRDLVWRRARLAGAAADLAGDFPLGAGGAGLDSITLAEVVLDCEQHFAVSIGLELLDGPPLTLGRLVGGVRTALARAGG